MTDRWELRAGSGGMELHLLFGLLALGAVDCDRSPPIIVASAMTPSKFFAPAREEDDGN
jgi:hypothetical protein